MGAALEQILGFVPLTASMKTVADGIPNPYPAELFNVQAKNRVIGDVAKYVRFRGERRTAQSVHRGAPARKRQLLEVGDANVKMIHEFESFAIDAQMLSKLRSAEQYVQDEGMQWLNYQLESLGTRMQNSRIVATSSILRHGAVYMDAEGNYLPTSSGAVDTFSVNVPATHQGQINSIIDASWANSNTDIVQHIINIKQYSLEETGMPLGTALYGKNIFNYLVTNSTVRDYLARNQNANNTLMSTGELDGTFMGLEWRPAYQSFFEDDDQTLSNLWDDDLVVFLPKMNQPDNMNWWGMYEGSYYVPKTLNISQNAMSVMSNLELVHGIGSYALVTHNPVGIEVFGFDTFFPALKNEKALFAADVTP